MKKYLEVSTWFVRETPKAFAIEYSTGRHTSNTTIQVWFPKSQCIISHPEDYVDPNRKLILIPLWLIFKHTNTMDDFSRFAGYNGIVIK